METHVRAGVCCFATALALAAPFGASAQEGRDRAPDVVCIQAGTLPPDLAPFDERTPLDATPGEYDLAVAQLTVGHAVDATLKPIADVDFVIDPERWPEPETYAGMFSFDAPAAGTYKVALSAGIWVDVIEGDDLVGSTAFGGAPACTSVRKLVEFPLQQGVHVLQLSGSPTPDVAVMVSYKPNSPSE